LFLPVDVSDDLTNDFHFLDENSERPIPKNKQSANDCIRSQPSSPPSWSLGGDVPRGDVSHRLTYVSCDPSSCDPSSCDPFSSDMSNKPFSKSLI
jgi:hypothetical protein